MKIHTFIAVILLLLLTAGCITPRNKADRLLCLELSNPAHTTIPDCSTQSNCFQKVEEIFGLKAEQASYLTKQNLYRYKNSLARSWLFVNKALANAGKIRSLCSAENDYFDLMQQANELANNAIVAFEQIQNVYTYAFKTLAAERLYLSTQKVELVPEEPVYSGLSQLNAELNELSHKDFNSISAGTFVGKFKGRMQRFEDFAKKLGFSQIYFNEFGFSELSIFYREEILQQLPENKFYVPIIEKSFLPAISFFTKSLRLNRSVTTLERIKPFDVMQFVDEFVGTGNSTATDFAEIFNAIQLHKTTAFSKNLQLDETIKQTLASAETELSHFAEVPNIFERQQIAELQASLQSGLGINVQKLSHTDLGNFKQFAMAKLSDLQTKYRSLQRDFAQKRASLGESLNSKKILLSDAQSLLENIKKVGANAFGEMQFLCDGRFYASEKWLASLPANFENETIADSFLKLRYKMKAYANSKGQEKLLLCKEIISASKALQSDLQNQSVADDVAKTITTNCLTEAEKILKNAGRNFDEELEKLKASAKRGLSADILQKSCENLLEKAKLNLYTSKEWQELQSEILAADSLLTDLKALSAIMPFANGMAEIDGVEVELSKLAKANYVEDNLQDLLFSAKTLRRKLQNNFAEVFRKYLIANSEVYSANGEIIFAVHNSFKDYVLPISLTIENPASAEKFLSADPSIGNAVVSDKQIILNLSSVPFGKTAFRFSLKPIDYVFDEKISVDFLSENSALLRQQFTLKRPKQLLDFVFQKDLPPFKSPSTSQVSFQLNGIEHDFYLDGNSIRANLQKLVINDVLILLLEINNPISVSYSLTNYTKTDFEESRLLYNLTINSNLPIELEKQKILLLLPFDAENAKTLKLYDFTGTPLKAEIVSNNKISFTVPRLSPSTAVNYSLEITTADLGTLLDETAVQINSQLANLSASEFASIRLLAEQLSADFSKIFDSNNSREFQLKQLTKLQHELATLSSKESDLQLQKQAAIETLAKFSEKIYSLQVSFSSLDTIGTADSSAQTLLQNLSQLFDLASEQLDQQNFQSAIDTSKKGLALANATGTTSAKDVLSKRFLTLRKNLRLQIDEAEILSQTDANSSDILQRLSQADAEIETHLTNDLFALAKSSLDEFESLLDSLLKNKNAARRSLLQTAESNLKSAFLQREKLSKKFADLQTATNLAQPDSKPQFYGAPIDSKSLQNIDDTLSDSKLDELKSKIENLSESTSLSATDLSKIKGANENISNFIKKLATHKKIVDSVFDKLKADAKLFLQKSETLAAAAADNENIQQFLQKAKANFSAGKFMESISFSEKILAASKPDNVLEIWPISAIPLIAGIIFLLAYKLLNRKKTSEDQALFRKIAKIS